MEVILAIIAFVVVMIAIVSFFEWKKERISPIVIENPEERHEGRDQLENRFIPILVGKLDYNNPDFAPYAKRSALKEAVESNGLNIKFEWHLLNVDFKMVEEKGQALQLYTFPTPEEDGEAFFGIIIFDLVKCVSAYVTLTKQGDKQVIIQTSPQLEYTNLGEYNQELTIDAFTNHILNILNNDGKN